MTLTLPIEIGKKYRRRDGVIVEAKMAHDTFKSVGFQVLVYVGEKSHATAESEYHAWTRSGFVTPDRDHDFDLVEDHVEPTAHPHAALMALYAQDAAETDEPWERWEYINRNDPKPEWYSLTTSHPQWFHHCDYRRKPEPPRTIRIGKFDVPEPLREAPEIGTCLFVPALHAVSINGSRASSLMWDGDQYDLQMLQGGMLHTTREAAGLHAKALLSFTSAGV